MAAASHTPSRARAPRIRWDRISRAAMLFALIILLYLAISPVRSLIADLHLSAERRAQLHALQRTATALADEERSLAQASTSDVEARNLGFVLPGEKEYVVKRLPSN